MRVHVAWVFAAALAMPTGHALGNLIFHGSVLNPHLKEKR